MPCGVPDVAALAARDDRDRRRRPRTRRGARSASTGAAGPGPAASRPTGRWSPWRQRIRRVRFAPWSSSTTGGAAGEPLVLLHGIGSRWQVFAPVLDLLAEDYEVWAVDMPGFGASPAPAARSPSIAGPDRRASRSGSASRASSARTWRATRPAAASRSSSPPRGVAALGVRAGPDRLLEPPRAAVLPGARCASPRARRSRWGRSPRPPWPRVARHAVLRAVLREALSARPRRGVATVEALAAPRVRRALAAFTGYVAPADAADRVPVDDRLGQPDRLLLPRQARRAQRLLPRARHVIVSGRRPPDDVRRATGSGRRESSRRRARPSRRRRSR